jgi:hypothetical protein
MKFAILTFLTLASITASAAPVTISDRRCVSGGTDHVVKAVTDYQNYSKIPEATLSIVGMKILTMTKSQEVKKVTASSDDSIVYIELRPLNFGEDKKDLFPRFFIRCRVSTQGLGSVRHECHSLTKNDLSDFGRPGLVPVPFGLSQFDSELLIEGDSANCASGESQITYKLVMDPNDSDVSKVQTGSGFGSFPLPQDQFFKAYYQNFYNGWTKTIR